MFETVGQKLGKHLGLNQDVNAVLQRAVNTSIPIYRVAVDSRHPYRTLLYSVLKKADTLKAGRYNDSSDKWKNLRFAPPHDLWSFDDNILSNAIILFNDLSSELYKGQRAYEAKDSNGKLRLREFTVYDMKSGVLDDFRKKFAKQRQSVKGQEVRLTKLIKAQIVDNKHVRFHFLSEPTFDFNVEVVNPKNLGANLKPDNTYDIFIELQDLILYLEDNELSFKELKLKRFREILQVVDAKSFCTCPSFHWSGLNKELSDLGGSLFPTTIPHTEWSKIYKKNEYGSFGLGCKHLGNLYKNISIFESVMLGKLREL